jgi:hypothetical protein
MILSIAESYLFDNSAQNLMNSSAKETPLITKHAPDKKKNINCIQPKLMNFLGSKLVAIVQK